MAVTVCRVFGPAFLLAGVAGFFMPTLLGFHLTLIHNLIHVATGALALYFGFAAPGGAAGFSKAFGLVYLLVALLGFAAPRVLATLLGHPGDVTAADLMPDNVFHVVVSLVFLAAGFRPGTAADRVVP